MALFDGALVSSGALGQPVSATQNGFTIGGVGGGKGPATNSTWQDRPSWAIRYAPIDHFWTELPWLIGQRVKEVWWEMDWVFPLNFFHPNDSPGNNKLDHC